jgi:hypothetical protein
MCAVGLRPWRRSGLRLASGVVASALVELLHLTTDYIHKFQSVRGTSSHCRIRVFAPEEEHDAPVVVCSELLDNPGIPVTGGAETIAAEVIATHWLVAPVWIEYHPQETTVAGVESFELVVFSDYKIRETVGPTGSRAEIGQPFWKPLDRSSVEGLVGQPLD